MPAGQGSAAKANWIAIAAFAASAARPEDGQDAVAFAARLDLDPSVLRHQPVDDRVVARHHRPHRARVRLPAARRALDVG